MLRSQKGPRLPSPVGGKPHGLGLGWGGVLQGDEQPPPEHPTWGVALLWPLGHHLELCLFHHLPEDRVGGWWSTASPEVGRTQSRGSVLKDEDMNPLQISKHQKGVSEDIRAVHSIPSSSWRTTSGLASLPTPIATSYSLPPSRIGSCTSRPGAPGPGLGAPSPAPWHPGVSTAHLLPGLATPAPVL